MNNMSTQEAIEFVNDKIYEIINIEGAINKVFKIGNSIIIQFENGKIYKQPLISLSIADACLDETNICNHKDIGTDGGGDYCKKCGKRL